MAHQHICYSYWNVLGALVQARWVSAPVPAPFNFN